MQCNASNSSLRWIGFSLGDQDLHPYVMNISPSSSSSSYSSSSAGLRYINLTWNLTVFTSASSASSVNETCAPLPSAKLPQYLPNSTSGIRLKSFADGIFSFSLRTIILLFNCTRNLTSYNTTSCGNLQLDCPDAELPFNTGNCTRLVLTTDLDLYKAMSDGNCSHFQMMVASMPEDAAMPMQAKVGMIQLYWNDSQLQSNANGSKPKGT
jgi:tRNA(Leu) C34 or U34 (ribose-2'-O)-methylase TrmL